MKYTLKHIVLLVLFFIHIQCLSQRQAFEAYYLHTKDYPSIDASPSWGEGGIEAQGITHDENYWYITGVEKFYYQKLIPALFFLDLQTFLLGFGVFLNLNTDLDKYQNSYLWKIPVSEPLDQDFSSNSKVKMIMLLQFTQLSDINSFEGYTHWGDIDYYLDSSKKGYLVIPATSNNDDKYPTPAIIIFRASDLSLVGFGRLPGRSKVGGRKQDGAGWCAVDSAGYVFSSSNNPDLDASTPIEGTSLFKYEVKWDVISKHTGYMGDISNLINVKEGIALIGPLKRYSDGTNSTHLSLHNMQGGQFSPSGELLYISNGSGSCKGQGEGSDPYDGIHVFDTKTWEEIKHSTNHERGDPANYFDYYYDPGCGFFETNSHTAEGLTIWDLDDGKAPKINGQLHVLVADVNAFPKNKAGIEHFGNKVYVDEVNGVPPAWTDNHVITGTEQRPFNTVNNVFNWYPIWDGAEIILKKSIFPESGMFKTRVKISSEGTSTIGMSSDISAIKLFKDKDYQGISKFFTSDIPNLADASIDFNDVATAVQLINVSEVRLYVDINYQGSYISITKDTPNLDDIGWNDKVSSLKIIK